MKRAAHTQNEMMREESDFARKRQKRAIDDSRAFVHNLCSKSLSKQLDLSRVEALEGKGDECNLHMVASQKLHQYMQQALNETIEVDVVKPDFMSTSYCERDTSSQGASMTKESFEKEFNAYHDKVNKVKERHRQLRMPREPITEADLKREIITIRYDEDPDALHMKMLIENYVYVTYFVNEEGERYRFNLNSQAANTMGIGVAQSRSKFAKNDLRSPWGSHLIFESGVVVETGCTSPVIAEKLLDHTLNVFQIDCGCNDIRIGERKCQNVVATGTLNFPISPELLKERYPFVTYDKESFAGVIIKLSDMDNHIINSNNGNGFTQNVSAMHSNLINIEKQNGYKDIEEIYNEKYNKREGPPLSSNLDLDGYELPGDYLVGGRDPSLSRVVNGISSLVEREKFVTALVFPAGQVICVGNTSRQGVIDSGVVLFELLEKSRATPENIKLAKKLARQSKGRPASTVAKNPNSKLRKRAEKKAATAAKKKKNREDVQKGIKPL